MRPYYSQVALPGTMSYLSNGIKTTVAYTASKGQKCEVLNILIPSVTGNFKAPTSFSWEKVSSTGLRGRTVRTDKDAPGFSGPFERIGGFQSPLDSNGRVGKSAFNFALVYNQALSDLSEKIRGSLDLSIDLFQAKQMLRTVNRIWSLTETLSRSVKRAIKDRRPDREIADYYLEWTYGIEPALKDAYALYDLLYKKSNSNEGLLHFRGRGTYVERSKQNYFMNIFTSDINVVAEFVSDLSFRLQFDVYLSPHQSMLQKLSSYTSLNPIAWVYEMTPYSFVLDWFWDFGGYLRNLETAVIHSDRVVSGCKTYTALEYTTLQSNTLSWGKHLFSDATGDHVYRWYERKPMNTLDVPKIPVWDVRLGSRRMLNAAALLSQLLPDLFDKERGRIRNDRRVTRLGRN